MIQIWIIRRKTLNKKINICHLLTHRGMQSPNVTEMEMDFAPLNFGVFQLFSDREFWSICLFVELIGSQDDDEARKNLVYFV